MRITLATLNEDGAVSANVVSQLSKIVDFHVPQGQFFALDTKRPQIVRLAAYETTTNHEITVGERSANAVVCAALTDQPVKPLDAYIPTWPDEDGYTFKVFIRHKDATYGAGPWTRATINAVDWTTKVLTIAIPATLVDYAGATHSLIATDKIDIRISYINTSGQLIWRRETPDNAATLAARTSWDVSTYILGVRDQLSEQGRLQFNTVAIWVPQQCHWRWYLNSPVAWDYDPSYSATQIEINATMIDMTKATSDWTAAMQANKLTPRYRTLYSLYLAQLAGIEQEAYPV